MADHALFVHVKPPVDSGIELEEIEDPLIEAIEAAAAGEFDGIDRAVDGSDAVLYMYGPDADVLWVAIEPVLQAAPLGPGSYAIKRYGEPGAVEARIELT